MVATKRQALYFPTDMLHELRGQAARLDRSLSWLLQQAWKLGRSELHRVPSTSDYLAEPPSGAAAAAPAPAGRASIK